MRLSYKAIGKDGKSVTGLVEAKDISEAATYLRTRELTPITIKKKESRDLLERLPFLKKSKSADLVFFTRQLSSMLTSGLTLIRSLEILKQQMRGVYLLEVMEGIITEIEGGSSFSSAIAKYPDMFSPIYVSIIKTAENSGLLDKALLRLADNLEKSAKLRSSIKGALMYPVIVVILMIVVVVLMMIFVIPQLSVLYENLNIPLPLPTQIIVGMSKFLLILWPLVIVFIVGIIALYRRFAKSPSGRLILDDTALKIPVFGKLIVQTILAEFSRTFGLLVGTGTLVVDALLQTANSAGNIHYKNAIIDVSRKVEKGITIGDAMSASPLFPPLLVQLVRIGEQTGKLDDSLIKSSEYFESEVDQQVKTLTTAMEPIIMIILGVGVAFLIISVITPIYSLISSIQ
ncbi:MAG: type II secretion system F family protein [Candidatus Levyibacteriota bacterium]